VAAVVGVEAPAARVVAAIAASAGSRSGGRMRLPS
jgi:hypothetical protein